MKNNARISYSERKQLGRSQNIKHAKVFIVIVKNYSNVEFIEVPFIALVKDFKIMKLKNIPTGNSKEDVEVRKKIIKDFYKQWEKNNPSKKLYNYNLKDYINVRLISIQETAFKASCNYLSTLAVLQLDAILQLARKICVVNTKPKDKNQNQFEKMIKMEYNLVGIGKVSLIVGIKRPNRDKIKEKVQYCITAIKA